MYIAHMRTMITENFSNGWYATRGAEWQSIAAPSVQADPNFFYSYTNFQNNLNSAVSGGGGGPGGGSIFGITQLMNTRATYLLNSTAFSGTVPAITGINHSPDVVPQNSTVNFTMNTTNATYAHIGIRQSISDKFTKYQMYDDGLHGDGAANDGMFGVSVNIGYGDVQYYGYAENAAQAVFLPARAEREFLTMNVLTETGELVINEINYHAATDFNTEDWVEIHNPGNTSIDLTGWVFKDDDNAHSYVIPNGTVINAGGFLVLCRDLAAFSAQFPDVTNAIGDFSFGLSSSGDACRLYNGEGAVVDSVTFTNSAPWPTAPNGGGPTLELINPALDNALATSWQASQNHGTPGAVNGGAITPVFGNVVINEINYSSAPDFNPGDWVELYNVDNTPVNLSNWVFKDSADNHVFMIPGGTTLPAHGYLVLCDSLAGFNALFPTVTTCLGNLGFGLSSGGELVRLYNNTGIIIDSLTYGVTAPWPIEPLGQGPTLALIDPALDNSLPTSWAASLGHGSPCAMNEITGMDDNGAASLLPSLTAYPNPFNPVLNLRITIPRSHTRTTVTIYNLHGQKVATLLDGFPDKGQHQIQWLGKDMEGKTAASGIYFAVLRQDGKTLSARKVVLMK